MKAVRALKVCRYIYVGIQVKEILLPCRIREEWQVALVLVFKNAYDVGLMGILENVTGTRKAATVYFWEPTSGVAWLAL